MRRTSSIPPSGRLAASSIGSVRDGGSRWNVVGLSVASACSWRAYLPKEYVPGPKVKVELYRRLGRVRAMDRLADFRKELVDRFGPLPGPTENLLAEAELRVLAEHWGIARIHVEPEYVVLTYRSARKMETLARKNPGWFRIVDDRTAYLPMEEKHPKGAAVAALVKSLLRES